MFWFWFWVVVHLLMLVFDVIWWRFALRHTKRRLWRVLVSVFIGGQMAALYSLRCGLDWAQYTPTAVLVAVAAWHYFVLGFGLAVFVPIGMVRACVRMARGLKRMTTVPAEPPPAPPPNEHALKRREFFGACAALAPPLVTFSLTGVCLAQLTSFRVRRFTLSIPALPKTLDGVTIAHVTDIHIGKLTRGRVLRDMVNTTNALRADLVVMTGDLIDYAIADLTEGIALVKALEGRYGLWMVEGNHDLFEDGAQFEQRVKAAGIPLLLNESALTRVRGYPVQLFGLGWVGGTTRQCDRATAQQMRGLMTQRHPDAFPIVLTHHPHAFDAAVKMDLPLTLAGHTHGGQCMVNAQHGIGSMMFRYWSGLYTRGRSQLVVSNGVGSWMPLRINAPAEIIHLTLRCAPLAPAAAPRRQPAPANVTGNTGPASGTAV